MRESERQGASGGQHPAAIPADAELPAGLALDARVAVGIMGWTSRIANEQGFRNVPVWSPRNCGAALTAPPRFSAEICSAWLVVEQMRSRGWLFQIDALGFDGEEWRVAFWRDFEENPDGVIHAEQRPSAPLAICRAALAATETERGSPVAAPSVSTPPAAPKENP